MPRVVFFGTPAAAVPSLETVSTRFEVSLVVTRPDARRGRSNAPGPSPVAEAAERLALDVAKPHSTAEIGEMVQEARPDVAVVVAFGKLIPARVLEMPRYGFVNVHFSVLPRWRGAAPVQRALMAGDERTGVSIMALDEGLDTGPVLAVTSTRFGAEEVAGEAITRLSLLGSQLLTFVLPGYLNGSLPLWRQAEAGACVASRITSSDRRLDLNRPAIELVRTVRALSPHPGASAHLEGEVFKVLRAREAAGQERPGFLKLDSGRLLCGTGSELIELIEVQPAGRSPMSGAAWARGWRSWPAVLT